MIAFWLFFVVDLISNSMTKTCSLSQRTYVLVLADQRYVPLTLEQCRRKRKFVFIRPFFWPTPRSHPDWRGKENQSLLMGIYVVRVIDPYSNVNLSISIILSFINLLNSAALDFRSLLWDICSILSIESVIMRLYVQNLC